MRLPDFLIIGAAKSGTTTLYEYLCRHPQIFMSTPKEPEFFARDEVYAKGLDWYKSLFADATAQQVCGEASTIYTRSPQFPHTAQRIFAAVPQVKLIYIMRSPIERAYSHYAQRVKAAQRSGAIAKVTETFEAAAERQPELIDSSNYMLQIETYLRYFPRESLRFFLFEDLLDRPEAVLQEICAFLDIDTDPTPLLEQPVYANQAKTHYQSFLRSQATQWLRRIPVVSNVANQLPQEVRDFAYHQVLRKLPTIQAGETDYLPKPMLPETRERLAASYQESTHRLSEFLSRDLSHWIPKHQPNA